MTRLNEEAEATGLWPEDRNLRLRSENRRMDREAPHVARPANRHGDDGVAGAIGSPDEVALQPQAFAAISARSVSRSPASSSVSGVRTLPAERPTSSAPALIIETA